MSDEPLWSYGGAAGLAVRLEDLERAQAVLALAGGELEDAVWTLASAARAGGPATGAGPAGLAARASGIAMGCRALSAALAIAVERYAEAEREAASGLSLAARLGEVGADAAGSVGWGLRWGAVLATALASPIGAASLLWDDGPRRLAPGGLPPHTSWLNGELAHATVATRVEDYDRVVAALAGALAAAEALEPDYRGVVPEPGPRPVALRDAGVAGTMRRLDWTEQLGGGAVAIETVAASDGSRRHVVYIPGTQDWGVTDPNPADAHANLVAVTGGVPDAGRAVRDALEAHGVAPDEPVMLAGHSQGGLIAAVGASALADRYRITHVLTAGSPTGRIATPSGVAVLHLENTRDVVPGLDGRANPDTSDRVTVVHDRRRSGQADAPDASRTVAEAHALEGYAATGALVDRGAGPSVRAWTDSAGAYLAGGRSEISVYRPAS
ncbi:hypothetical protein [Demequina lignilytica]|uniref:PGAP1-like protein n=1 Tax=Demequina lignilytica TaxID=3051663 RepID=A0AB35MIA5_9MICO|nr:hypothetical protein [Demequina sp. SYSU T0a273]MDN4483516.1 hypothetical protein [Demequina sp. SYSU T0a273]